MKRCPKCNRSYSTDTQKFCTHDGGLLFMVEEELSETVQFDSSKVRDAVAKPTTRDLSEQQAAAFDPEATVVRSGAADGTQQVKARDTGSLEPPPQTQYYGAPPSAPVSQPPSPPPSGPIPPPPTSPPPPVSGPITAPAATPSIPIPPPQPAAAAAPSASRPLPAAAPKKKSKLPLVLGILAVLIVVFVGIAAVVGYFLLRAQAPQAPIASEPTRTGPSLPSSATPSEISKPANEPAPYNPPADAVQFVNMQEGLSGKLAENFVAFSFYYPNSWVKVPSPENFIEVERRLPPDFTQENFVVAPWYSTASSTTFDEEFFRPLAAKDSADLARKLPEYRKISEGPTKVGAYDAYEFRFEGTSRGTDKGDVTLWGREIFFPPREGEKTGVKFLILTTSLAPELKSIDDVGAKGELPMLLESFRFGK